MFFYRSTFGSYALLQLSSVFYIWLTNEGAMVTDFSREASIFQPLDFSFYRNYTLLFGFHDYVYHFDANRESQASLLCEELSELLM